MDVLSKQALAFTETTPADRASLAPPLEKLRLHFYTMQVVLDVCAILAGHFLASLLYHGDAFEDSNMRAGQMMALVYLTIAFYSGAYSRSSLANYRKGIRCMAIALGIAFALFNFIAFYAKANAEFSRLALTFGLLFSFGLLAGSRVLVAWNARSRFGPNLFNVLVIDDGGPELELPHSYRISAIELGLCPALDDPHQLNRIGGYLHNMDRVVVSCIPERRLEWSFVLKGSGVNGEIVSDFAREIGAIGVRRYDQAGLSALVVSTGPLGLRDRAIKRIFDIVVAGTGLVFLSPLLLAVALAVVAQDRGPVIFRQRRLGRGNRFFSMYKFRTMRVDGADADGFRSTAHGDARVTRIGHFLRRTSIDELPQLMNVLLGHMSIVGPRPHAIGSSAEDKYFWEIDRRYWERHALKPGLTGLAQVRGHRGATHRESDFRLRLQSDLEYLNGWSIMRDVRIVFLTMRVLRHDRAF